MEGSLRVSAAWLRDAAEQAVMSRSFRGVRQRLAGLICEAVQDSLHQPQSREVGRCVCVFAVISSGSYLPGRRRPLTLSSATA